MAYITGIARVIPFVVQLHLFLFILLFILVRGFKLIFLLLLEGIVVRVIVALQLLILLLKLEPSLEVFWDRLALGDQQPRRRLLVGHSRLPTPNSTRIGPLVPNRTIRVKSDLVVRPTEGRFAAIGPLMRLDVLSEVIASAKLLATSTAAVRFLHRVRANVSFEMLESLEVLPTREQRAGKRSDPTWMGRHRRRDAMRDDGRFRGIGQGRGIDGRLKRKDDALGSGVLDRRGWDRNGRVQRRLWWPARGRPLGAIGRSGTWRLVKLLGRLLWLLHVRLILVWMLKLLLHRRGMSGL